MPVSTQTRSAILWKTAEVLGQRLGWFIIGMVLARLVAPADFGLFALMMVFNLLAILFVDSGFNSALIQKQDITYTDECSVFWFNMLAGTLVALLMVAASPWIASFFGYEVLKPLTWLMAANLWIHAWTSVPSALLSKQLNFKVQMQAGLIATFSAGALSIYLAWIGWGVWALAMQFFATTAIRSVLLWTLYRWRPARRFNPARMREMFSFGSYIFFSSLLEVFSSQLHAVLIGRYYSAASLGYFNRATSTRDLLQSVMTTIYNSVAFPLFSSFAQDRGRLRESMQKSTVAMMAINLPVMMGLLVTADDLIPTLFGDQWIPSVPYMQVLCLAGMIWPMQVSPLNMLKALGHSKLMFRLGLLKHSVMIKTIAVTAQISILAMAWGLVAVSATAFLINSHYSGRMLNYGALKQLRDVLPYILLSAAMAMMVMLAGAAMSDLATGWRALTQVLAGSVFYLGAMHMLKMDASSYAKDLLRLR